MNSANDQKQFLTIETGGHTANISDLIVTADRQAVITCSEDKTIRVWDVATRQQTRKILGQVGPGRTGLLTSMALSPDNKYLAVAVYAGSNEAWGRIPYQPGAVVVRLFEYQTGNLLKVFDPGHRNVVTALAFSEDQRYLATGAEDRSIKLWEFDGVLRAGAQSEPVATITHELLARSAALRIIKKETDYWVYSADYSEHCNSLLRYSLQEDKVLSVYRHEDRLQYLAVSDTYIAACGYSHHILIFDHELNLHKSIESRANPDDLYFSPDGTLLLAGSKDAPSVCNVYDVTQDFQRITSFDRHDARTQAVAFLDDNTAVSCGGDQKEMMFWEPRTGKLLGQIAPKGSTVYAVGLDGKQVAFGNTQRYQEDANNYAPLEKYFDLSTFELHSIDAATQSRFKRPVTQRGEQELFIDPNAGWALLIKKGGYVYIIQRGHWHYHEAFSFSEDGNILTAGRGGEVKAFDNDGTPIGDFIGHADRLWDLSTEKNWLVTGGVEQVIKVWNLDDLKQDRREHYPLLNIFVSTDDEWVVWSQSGYYNASLHGDKHIGYIVNQGPNQEALWYTSDRFIKTLYRPDIITAILETGSEAAALAKVPKPTTKAVSDTLPPKIDLLIKDRIETDKPQFDLEFEVTAQSDPISRIWVLQNGRFLLEKKAEDAAIDTYQCLEVELAPGQNAFTILAESVLAKSNPVEVHIEADASGWSTRAASFEFAADTTKEADPHLYLLSIGVSEYKNAASGGINNLKFAHADATQVAKVFGQQAGKVYEKIVSKVLTDAEATREGVLKAVEWLNEQVQARAAANKKANVKSKDVALIFMAGHGVKKEDQFYFLTHDADVKKLSETAVALLDIGQTITTFPSELIIMTDACHAGKISGDALQVIESKELSKRLTSLNERAQVILNATSGDKPAFELRKFKHGAFTKIMLDGLEEYDRVSVLTLTDFVQRNVQLVTKDYRFGPQKPNITIYGTYFNYDLYKK